MKQTVLNRLDKINGMLGKFELAFSCTLLIAMVVVVGAAVFLRYVLKSPLVAGVNFATLLLVWLTFFGASFVYRERGHIAIDFVIDRLPAFLRHTVMIAVYTIIGGILIIICVQSGYLIEVQWKQEIVALDIPRSFLSIPVLMTSMLMIFTTLRHIVLEINVLINR